MVKEVQVNVNAKAVFNLGQVMDKRRGKLLGLLTRDQIDEAFTFPKGMCRLVVDKTNGILAVRPTRSYLPKPR